VVEELLTDRILCKRVTLKIKTVNFEILTRSKTLSSYTDSLNLITEKAIALLKHELDQDLELPALRLMGKTVCKARLSSIFLFTGVRVADLKMKSTDLPILQFFSKASTTSESTHDLIEDVDDEDDDDEDSPPENQHQESCEAKIFDEDSNSSTISCPVCQKMLLGDNDKVNKHIDLCLNGEMIRTTIKEEEQRTSPQANTQKRIQSTQVKSTPPAKRQKRKLNIASPGTNGIDNYFFKSDKCT
jgi:DNA polymerase kappa